LTATFSHTLLPLAPLSLSTALASYPYNPGGKHRLHAKAFDY